MRLTNILRYHSLFIVFFLLFLLVAFVDIFNYDRQIYSYFCGLASPVSHSACPTFYDLPIWNVYLSLAILAGLYHVHGEIRISNKHLSSQKH